MNDEQKEELRRAWEDPDIDFPSFDEDSSTRIAEELAYSELQTDDVSIPSLEQIRSSPHESRSSFAGGEFGRKVAIHLKSLYEASKEGILNAVREPICVKFDFCGKLQRNELDLDGIGVATAIADSLISLKVNLPVPATQVSVWLVKKRLLPMLCRCPEN